MGSAWAVAAIDATQAVLLACVLALLVRRRRQRRALVGEGALLAATALLLAADLLDALHRFPPFQRCPVLRDPAFETLLENLLLRTTGIALLAWGAWRMFPALDALTTAARRRDADPAAFARLAGVLDALVEAFGDGLIVFDEDGRARFLNDEAARLLGLDDDGKKALTLEALLERALDANEMRRWRDAADMARRGRRRARLRKAFLRRPSGEVVVVRLTVAPTKEGLVVALHDVADWAEEERRMAQLADEDPLTGLLNRRGFERAAQREIARARRYGRPLALVMLDLDHFKRINDRYGHDVGDAVLRELGARLRAVSRAADAIGRLGGEEFAVLLPETPPQAARRFAERLLERITTQPFSTPAGELRVTASIGVAGLPAHAGSYEELLRAADQALYLAKRSGRARIVEAGGDELARQLLSSAFDETDTGERKR